MLLIWQLFSYNEYKFASDYVLVLIGYLFSFIGVLILDIVIGWSVFRSYLKFEWPWHGNGNVDFFPSRVNGYSF